MGFLLFLRLTPDREKIIGENYNYYSTVTNIVLHWACRAHTASADMKYANNVGNTLQSRD